MGTVLVTRRLPAGSLDELAGAGHRVVTNEDVTGDSDPALTPVQLRDAARGADAVISLLTDRIDEAFFDAAADVRVVANVAVGYDNIDVEAAHRRGVVVCNTPGVLTETTADLAFALILAASRLLSSAEDDLRGGRWHGWGIGQYLGHDVHGATLGIIGYGAIGRAVARRAHGFGMRVLHHSRQPTGEEGFVGDVDALLAECDVVTLHVPLTSQTRHLIDARRLALMRPTAVLVNTARGPVVDEGALADALESGRLFAAGIDVYEREPEVHPRLLAAPRTVLLPHIGSASVATRTAMARMAAAAVIDVLAGRAPANPVA